MTADAKLVGFFADRGTAFSATSSSLRRDAITAPSGFKPGAGGVELSPFENATCGCKIT